MTKRPPLKPLARKLLDAVSSEMGWGGSCYDGEQCRSCSRATRKILTALQKAYDKGYYAKGGDAH